MKKLLGFIIFFFIALISNNVWAAPTADFTGRPIYGVAPLSVQFTDASTGSVNSWQWNFGDGATSTQQNPVHVYNAAGTYTVTLTVSGPGGSGSAIKGNYVTVDPHIPPSNNEYRISVDPVAHQKFGLYYPVTYKFSIGSGLSNLSAQYRYVEGNWGTLIQKSSTDIFNGIDAVRFDYSQGYAYVSVGFKPSSDSIYVRIVDGNGQPVPMVFAGIPQYYDNRKAAVTITLDDCEFYTYDYCGQAADSLAALGLYFTVGLVTGDTVWSLVQDQINRHGDYIEVASHSMHHSQSASDYQRYGYANEVIGSRDQIRNKLVLQDPPYVPAYIEPGGYSDATLQSSIASGNYLVTRSTLWWTRGKLFATWDSTLGMYDEAYVTCDDWHNNSAAFVSECNPMFDSIKSTGGIYHLTDHPWQGFWNSGSYLLQHLNYIKGRNDVWYVPFGQLYMYHYLQEMRGNLSVSLAQ